MVGEKDAIPITKLAEIIKESMQVFGEFIRADKVETFAALKGIQGSPVDHLNPADLELFINIKTCLEKVKFCTIYVIFHHFLIFHLLISHNSRIFLPYRRKES